MKRGSINRRESKLIPFWLPDPVVKRMDDAVAAEDTDRSKFVRKAIRERLERLGIKETETT